MSCMWEIYGEKCMNKENAKTRDRIKQIETIEQFENLLNKLILSDEERNILILHYKEQKPLVYIADVLGMSESTVKRKHKKLLMKVGKLFN